MIIDTHQHFWNVGKPSAKGPEDYKILTAAEGVTGTLLRLEDADFALELAAREPFIVGVNADIKSGPAFEAELEKYSANPLFRGIRYLGREIENVEKGSFLSDMEKLAAKDLQLDLLRVCEWKKHYGAMHFGIGHGADCGKINSILRLEGITDKITMTVDDKLVCERGKFVV